jgi:hypothetical protein
MRGLSLHYSRQRRCADFFQKLASLLSDSRNKKICEGHALGYKDEAGMFDLLYLQRGVARNFPTKQGVSYYCIPISRNLGVSCCGCFKPNTDWYSGITYNMISYPDITILLLTVFEATKHHLDSFTERYSIPQDAERLVNEIVFEKSEAPLIAPRLWHSLSDEQKRDRARAMAGFEAQSDGVIERVECAEADLPGRRRGDEYQRAANQLAVVHDPVENWTARADQVPAALSAAIQTKVGKHYGSRASLLVYLNIGEYGIRQAEIEAAMPPAVATALLCFARVWILWKARL